MEQGGPQALRAKPRGGRHSFVPPERLDGLGEILSRGALSFGYDTDLCTLPRVARVLEKEWGVHYSHSGVWLLLKIRVVLVRGKEGKPELVLERMSREGAQLFTRLNLGRFIPGPR